MTNNHFDLAAKDWDKNPMHWERSEAIANLLVKEVPLKQEMKALEYGAGTAILSFMLHEHFTEITLMDSSQEMVKVMNQKIAQTNIKNLKPLLFDLEQSDYTAQKFDLVFTQMVLHHVTDIEGILNKFHQLLNPGGYLAIADLYAEDGSFHGEEFTGHKGFAPEQLAKTLEKLKFGGITHKQCYCINRVQENGKEQGYPIFLLTATR
jgi:tRNA (cmo5U34)-methyltransferase